MFNRIAPIVFGLMIVATACAYGAVGQLRCEQILKLALPRGSITSAVVVPAGPFTPPPDMMPTRVTVNVPTFCRVSGVLKPTSDSDIGFELWLPLDSWNGKFQQVGNGGFAGVIAYTVMLGPLLRGYATASTDDGHKGFTIAKWAVGHPEKLNDFAYRAVHETAEQSKRIVASFYGKRPSRSYFNGCSEGGREALMEAQRFPEDFNGIIVGAPASYWTHQFAGFVWNEQALLANSASYIPGSKLPLIQAAAIAHCTQAENTATGIVDDPRHCSFDPAVLKCAAGDGPNCLTPQQVTALKKIYAGPADPKTGEQIYAGYEPGAEADPADWPVWIIGDGPGKGLQSFFGNTFFGEMVYQSPNWNFRTFNFESDMKSVDAKFGTLLNAINPDLNAFRAHGGKMIQYHGWADSAVAPLDSIRYYNEVVASAGKAADDREALHRTEDFYRLFMVPGMAHCSGGPGASAFGNQSPDLPIQQDPAHDVVTALDRWVERGTPPDKLIATAYVGGHGEQGVKSTQLLCPYPEAASWTGHGSKLDASNFVCRVATRESGKTRSHTGPAASSDLVGPAH
jgi:hypothetical protein